MYDFALRCLNGRLLSSDNCRLFVPWTRTRLSEPLLLLGARRPSLVSGTGSRSISPVVTAGADIKEMSPKTFADVFASLMLASSQAFVGTLARCSTTGKKCSSPPSRSSQR
jgi:hypothetical protein